MVLIKNNTRASIFYGQLKHQKMHAHDHMAWVWPLEIYKGLGWHTPWQLPHPPRHFGGREPIFMDDDECMGFVKEMDVKRLCPLAFILLRIARLGAWIVRLLLWWDTKTYRCYTRFKNEMFSVICTWPYRIELDDSQCRIELITLCRIDIKWFGSKLLFDIVRNICKYIHQFAEK